MKRTWIRFAQDERGFVISAELVLVMTLGVLSMVVGLQAVSSSITQELNDVANAFGAVSQSYNYRSITKRRHAWVSGSGFHDRGDFCDCNPILQTDIVGHAAHSGHAGAGMSEGEIWIAPEGDVPFGPPILHDPRPIGLKPFPDPDVSKTVPCPPQSTDKKHDSGPHKQEHKQKSDHEPKK